MSKVAWSDVVITTEPRIGVVVAGTKAKAQVNGKTGANNRSTEAIEADKCWASKPDPAAIPTVVSANENTRCVYDAIRPSVRIRTFANISRPRRIASVVIPDFNALIDMVSHTDDLVRPIYGDVKARVVIANVVASLVKRGQAIFPFGCKIMER